MKRVNTSDIRSFFSKTVAGENRVQCAPQSVVDFAKNLENPHSEETGNKEVENKLEIFPNDIGNCLNKNLSPVEKYNLLKNTWTPDENFKFPALTEKTQIRSFQSSWLKELPWLAYSNEKCGAFCKFCALFSSGFGGIGGQPLKTLIVAPFNKYKNAKSDFKKHALHSYHLIAKEKTELFLKNYEDNSGRIDVLIDQNKQNIIDYNKRRLLPIIKTALFCAQNNLPLRGHRDDGSIQMDEEFLHGEGVFRNLLLFRVDAGDTQLESHLRSAPHHCTLIGKTIQNEIISCIGKVIQSAIIAEVKQSRFYSILCDETTDVSAKEQMSLCVRYVDLNSHTLKEEFLGFYVLHSTTGEAIKTAIFRELKAFGLNLGDIRGQGYDGGSNMAGKFKGVQALICDELPQAVYCHCANHALNLCISKSCEVTAIKNMMGIVGSISNFFSGSAKRAEILKNVITASETASVSKKTKLKGLCATRWVERHDCILTFRELFSYVLTALEILESDHDTDTSSKAASFSAACKRSNFMVALEITAVCFSHTVNLSKELQNPRRDISEALSRVKNVLETLIQMRQDADNAFDNIYANILVLAELAGENIKVPRQWPMSSKGVIPGEIHSDPKAYYRRTIFIPFLDHFISEIKLRFNEKLKSLISLEGLIPININKYSIECIMDAAKIYESDLKALTQLELETELTFWKSKWNGSKDMIPYTAMQAMSRCDSMFFPNVYILLQILATVPVTTATPERTFSVMKRIKTYLRSTQNNERLNGLALANIYRDRPISTGEIMSTFLQLKPRRMITENWTEES